MVQLPKVLASEDRTLFVERTDRLGERHEFKIDDTIAATGFYDLDPPHMQNRGIELVLALR